MFADGFLCDCFAKQSKVQERERERENGEVRSLTRARRYGSS